MNSFDLEKRIRKMIVNIIYKYNEDLIKRISKKYNLDEEKMLEKYLTPYHYMPIIEREMNKINI